MSTTTGTPATAAITPTVSDDQLRVFKLTTFADRADITHQCAWNWVRRGRIASVRIGKRIYIPATELLRIARGEL